MTRRRKPAAISVSPDVLAANAEIAAMLEYVADGAQRAADTLRPRQDRSRKSGHAHSNRLVFAVDRPMLAFVKLDSLSYCCNYLAVYAAIFKLCHPAQLGIHISGKANHVLDCRVFHR